MEYQNDDQSWADIEADLYAQIHHDAPETVEQYSAGVLLQQNHSQSRVVTKQSVVNKSGKERATAIRNGRYWSDGKPLSEHQRAKAPPAKQGRLNPFSVANRLDQQSKSASPPTRTEVPADYRPKPFTPYTSCISQIGSLVNNDNDSNSNEAAVPDTHLSTDVISHVKKSKKNLPNPFSRLNDNKLKRNVKLITKKKRAAKAKAKKRVKAVETINLDSSEEEEDDDIICIPVPAPPLVCIESTDNETDNEAEQAVQHPTNEIDAVIAEDFIEHRDRSRTSKSIDDDVLGGIEDEELAYICETVESALLWCDTDIWATNTNNADEGIAANVPPIPIESSAEFERSSSVRADDSVVFATPQKASVSNVMTPTTKPKYEVSEHAFAAVDVYESESSDFSESVYSKGKRSAARAKGVRPTNKSDSECSDLQVNPQNRSKRMMKRRKSLGSNKGSDYKTDDGGETDEETGTAFFDIVKNTSTPYLQRGDAINNAKSDAFKLRVAARRKAVANKLVPSEQADDEFLSVLSCIVHDDADKDVTTDDQYSSSNKTNDIELSIDARQVVEHVLGKQSKSSVAKDAESEKWVITDEVVTPDGVDDAVASEMSKVSDSPGEADIIMEDTNNEGKSLTSSWIVKDQVGETDNFIEEVLPIVDDTLLPIISVTPKAKDNAPKTTEAAQPVEPIVSDMLDNLCVRSCSLAVDPEIGWNDEMKRFYHNSWGGENFNVKAIQRSMPNGRYEWHVLPEDTNVQRRHNRFRNVRCLNCREEGHRMQDCYMPPKQVKCHMCGEIGHREPRCPQTMCLKCGNRNNVYSRGCNRCYHLSNMICTLCKTRGHGIRECPDKWRRYHSTIDAGQTLTKLPLILKKPRYCCICAGKGHTAEYCRHALRILDSPAPPLQIQSYSHVYDPINQGSADNEEAARFALMSAPVENVQFSWDVDESANRFYGRIITATNITRQSNIEPAKQQLYTSAPSNEDIVQMVINPMSAVNQVPDKQKKKFAKNFYEDTLPATVQQPDDGGSPVATIQTESIAETSVEVEQPMQRSTQLNVTIESDEPVNFSFTLALNEIQNHKFDLKKIFEIDPKSTDVTTSLADTLNAKESTAVNAPADTVSLSGSSVFVTLPLRKCDEATEIIAPIPMLQKVLPKNSDKVQPTSFEQRQSTSTEPPIKKTSLQRKIKDGVQHLPDPRTPSPPSMLNEFDQIAAEVRRLDHSQKFLDNLKHTLSDMYSNNNQKDSYVVSLNENVEESVQAVKRTRLDSDSNYSFSEYFEGDLRMAGCDGDQMDKTKSSPMSFDGTVSSEADFIPFGNDSLLKEDTVDEDSLPIENNNQTDLKSTQSTIYLSKEHCKFLLTRSGNIFLTDTYAKHSVVVRMEWRSFGNILIVDGSTRAQNNFHRDLIAYCVAAEKEARQKKLVSQKLPKNRLSMIKFIKDQITELKKSHGNVKELYLRMCMSEKQNTKGSHRNADRSRRLLNIILMGQTGLRDGAQHLLFLQSHLKSLLDSKKNDVSNGTRDDVFKHFQYIFTAIEHNDYPGLLQEYEAIRKQGRRPNIQLDPSLLGFDIDVEERAIAATGDEKPETEAMDAVKRKINPCSKFAQEKIIDAPPALIEAVKRMKKNLTIKTEDETNV